MYADFIQWMATWQEGTTRSAREVRDALLFHLWDARLPDEPRKLIELYITGAGHRTMYNKSDIVALFTEVQAGSPIPVPEY